MNTTRRDLLKFGALATAAAALPSLASSGSAPGAVGKAAKPLNILILGGTGFTGPFQVARIRRQTSTPLRSGSPTSRSTRSGGWARTASRASDPLAATATSYPSCWSRNCRNLYLSRSKKP